MSPGAHDCPPHGVGVPSPPRRLIDSSPSWMRRISQEGGVSAAGWPNWGTTKARTRVLRWKSCTVTPFAFKQISYSGTALLSRGQVPPCKQKSKSADNEDFPDQPEDEQAWNPGRRRDRQHAEEGSPVESPESSLGLRIRLGQGEVGGVRRAACVLVHF